MCLFDAENTEEGEKIVFFCTPNWTAKPDG
jgi:hypothetical protein